MAAVVCGVSEKKKYRPRYFSVSCQSWVNYKWYLSIKKGRRKPPPVTTENQYEMVAKSSTPLHDLPYEDQLKRKTYQMKAMLKSLANHLIHCLKGDKVPSLMAHIEVCEGLAGLLETIKPSPVIEKYRNKDEVSIGEGTTGKLIAGHLVGIGKFGEPTCVEVSHLCNIKDCHRLIIKLYNKFLRTSPLPPFVFPDKGHWKSIKVRSNLEGETMLIVRFHPGDLSHEEIEKAKQELLEFFNNGEGSACGLASLYFQVCWKTKCTNDESPYILLHGKTNLQEKLLGNEFTISPDSFFQVNTLGAEILYNTVKDYCELSETTTLLDLCCGTGTIGILLSRYVKKVLGVEKIQQAVDDAEISAKHNGVDNAKFFCSNANSFLSHMMCSGEISEQDDLVAVLNPGRGGLRKKLMKNIRECRTIRRVVYVTCKPKGLCFNNFKSLCQPEDEEYLGKPFLLKKAVPVDMFPQTNHCELVMQFER